MRFLRYAAATLLAVAAGLLILPNAASAHGAMMAPGSRTYLCYLDGKDPVTGQIIPHNAACAAAVNVSGPTSLYNWFAVLRSNGAGRVSGFIPDGQLCSGGTGGPYDFTGYNLARNDWPVTHLTAGGTMEIDYNDWAKHPGTFSLYVTKDGYDPTKPLAWGDLDPTPFSQSTNPPANGGPGTDAGHYYWNATLPSGKSGRHLIYSVWSRSDSTETFYGCSDVVFDGGHGEVTGVGTGPTTPPTSTPPTSTPPTRPPTTPPTTPPTSNPPGNGGCQAMYSITGTWNGGFQAQVMVHATDTALTHWTVTWTWPGAQTLTQAWNGTATSSGSLVTVKNTTWNGTVKAGDFTTFGLLGNGSTPATVNNLSCSSS